MIDLLCKTGNKMPNPTPNRPSKKQVNLGSPTSSGWRQKAHEIIFEADTFYGKLFDVCLLIAIVLSVVAVCLESMYPADLNNITPREEKIINALNIFEWCLTILFLGEYILRLFAVKKPLSYAKSFYGVVDILAILPSFLELFLGLGSTLAVVRAARLVRVFRIFKLVNLLSEGEEMFDAIWRAKSKVIVFICVVVIAITIAGAAIYEIEGHHRPGNEGSEFKSIPHGMYWATVTMTTVGFGDMVPKTNEGKVLTTFLILLGYSLIIVPTGFVSAEFVGSRQTKKITTNSCPSCITEGHDMDSVYCKYCGESMTVS